MIKSNRSLAEIIIKNEIEQLYLKTISLLFETTFMNMENSKMNEPLKFVTILNLRSSIRHVALQNLSIYFTSKNIERQCKTIN